MAEELKNDLEELNTILSKMSSRVRYSLSYSSCYYTLVKHIGNEGKMVLRGSFIEVSRHVFVLKDMFETLMYGTLDGSEGRF